MLPEQRQRIQESWSLAASSVDELTIRFYARLFEIDPGAARLFAGTDMVSQRRKFADMMHAIVAAIDEPRQLVPGAAALARRHVAYGVEDRHYDSVGDAFLHALAQSLGAAFTDEVRTAWSEAYALLASVMRRAANRPSGAHPAAGDAPA